MKSAASREENAAPKPASPVQALSPVGQVTEIAGSGSQIRMDAAVLNALQAHPDMSVAMSGQVGSQVKMIVGNNWLIANVRTMSGRRGRRNRRARRLPRRRDQGSQPAGSTNFRRGVTRYPIPGARFTRLRPTTFARSSRPATSRTSRSAPSIRPTTSAARSTSIPCSASTSRCWDRPVPVSRPASR